MIGLLVFIITITSFSAIFVYHDYQTEESLDNYNKLTDESLVHS